MQRRTFLKILGGSLGTLGTVAGVGPLFSALADAKVESAQDEFFLLIHAAGGWDVTLFADPRNERKGLVEPASSDNTDIGLVTKWKDRTLDEDSKTFEIVQPTGCKIPFGPGIGVLSELFDRVTLVNGLAMNTVSHPDGTTYSATGRHLVGGRTVASSIDTMLGNELGTGQTFPVVSVGFPSSFVGENLDRRVVPLRIGNVGALTRTLARSNNYTLDADRAAVTTLLSDEARSLAKTSSYPDSLEGMAVQFDALSRMLGSKLDTAFGAKYLKDTYTGLDFRARFAGGAALNAAFAIEAMRRNVVRCVSFSMGGFDTHNTNYRTQAVVQQELFGLIAATVRAMDGIAHPTKVGHKLSDHVHVLVVSDFCRTPQINLNGGRDHYPNNSAVILSPRFIGNLVFGKTDQEQLLPTVAKTFTDGPRAITPPDLLATFVAAFGGEPRKYLRDGEVVKELLRT